MNARRAAGALPDRQPAGPREDLVLTALVLAYGAASQQTASPVWEVPANLAAAASAIAIARAQGASWGELGLEPTAVPDGLRLGIVALAPVATVIALGTAIPATRQFFADERIAVHRGYELAYHAVVRIPLATATAEELLFRSALLGGALHRHGRRRAVVSTAIVFGLWHIVPALRSHEANPAGAELTDRAGGRVATVAATIVATTAAGLAFSWLRLRSRSVAASIVVHAGVNLGGLAAASWLARRSSSARG